MPEYQYKTIKGWLLNKLRNTCNRLTKFFEWLSNRFYYWEYVINEEFERIEGIDDWYRTY